MLLNALVLVDLMFMISAGAVRLAALILVIRTLVLVELMFVVSALGLAPLTF